MAVRDNRVHKEALPTTTLHKLDLLNKIWISLGSPAPVTGRSRQPNSLEWIKFESILETRNIFFLCLEKIFEKTVKIL